MLRIDCPFCGLRNHDEFTYLEDGSVKMPALANIDKNAWYEAVFLRENPRGAHIEDWHHTPVSYTHLTLPTKRIV